MRDNGGHAPQLGSCTFVRSIYYNQHTRIFQILSAEHLDTPRSVRFRPILSGTCYTPRREALPPLRLIRDVGVSIRSVSVWAGLFSPLKIGPMIRRNRGGLASQTNKENKQKILHAWEITVCKQSEESTCSGSNRLHFSQRSIVEGSHHKCRTRHFPKVVAAWRQRYIWSKGQTGSHRYHNE